MAASDKKSVLEQIRTLKDQEAKLVDGAKAEALAKATEAIAELQELGFHYRLVEGLGEPAKGQKAKAKATGIKGEQKDAPCVICGFKTSPLHDGRAHRSQDPKKPFTARELSERGLAKVA